MFWGVFWFGLLCALEGLLWSWSIGVSPWNGTLIGCGIGVVLGLVVGYYLNTYPRQQDRILLADVIANDIVYRLLGVATVIALIVRLVRAVI